MRLLKNKLAATVIVLSVTFLGLIIYSVKRENITFVENGIGVALNPVQKVAYTVTGNIRDFWDFATSFSKVKSENEELKKRNNELEKIEKENKDLKSENERLQEMLNFKTERNEEYIGAHIVDKANGLEIYAIDKGEKDGIKPGMVVVTSSGLFGKVAEVGSNWSKVYSLLNENISVAAMIDRTKETTGIVRGYRDANNKSVAKVYNLPIDSEVKEGDDVMITSGEGQIYPKGLKIGKVLAIEEDRGKVMKIATIEPCVNFSKLEEIFVIVPKDPLNIKYN